MNSQSPGMWHVSLIYSPYFVYSIFLFLHASSGKLTYLISLFLCYSPSLLPSHCSCLLISSLIRSMQYFCFYWRARKGLGSKTDESVNVWCYRSSWHVGLLKGAGFKVGIGTLLFTGNILYLSEMKFYFQCAYLMLKTNFICCILKYIFTFYAVGIFRFSAME